MPSQTWVPTPTRSFNELVAEAPQTLQCLLPSPAPNRVSLGRWATTHLANNCVRRCNKLAWTCVLLAKAERAASLCWCNQMENEHFLPTAVLHLTFHLSMPASWPTWASCMCPRIRSLPNRLHQPAFSTSRPHSRLGQSFLLTRRPPQCSNTLALLDTSR
ncbi:unannotated protein [freshwater metagenome]|uniref:Unannotated protein n=1 Tax=freshwater metagenome TaxID=449393 RepID=A0A6J6V2C0_9ZZZZ